jgi:3-polyprenyl-4-hydroxybenzoate decarboxylase
MGTLVSLEVTPYMREVYDAQGAPVIVASPQTQRVTVVVRGTGHFTDTAATMGSEKIRQNMSLDLQLPHFQLPGRIVSITKVDE